ncbi:Holliday junction branch migration protein RuvA [Mobiluncus mulieris]|uniref:Holliday junction branch migration complex subunit RuvA n=1 Tax=Mobiluncus mulieris TaxID=2052 RepID=A0A7Y0U028_9ACTO|nr:Holliday junction branch migration protein RuvA [Mobiluncus mulieris]
MIALLKGQVVDKRIDRATILCGGLGLEFFATPNTLSTLNQGQDAEIYTCLVVREDALTLYGFDDFQQRETFQILIQVKGIGPKLALATLAVLSPSDLANAVANRDLTTLQRIPGVGKKSAERMSLEIGDKLGIVPTSVATAATGGGFNATTVVEALTNLGWSQAQATEAVNAIEANDAATALREALQYLGSNR